MEKAGGRSLPRLPTAAPASIMALGIFGLEAMRRIEGGGGAVRPLALVLLALWLLMAASYIRDGVKSHASEALGGFQLGTWVAGTSVMGQMLLLGFPGWRWLEIMVAMICAATWVSFVPLAVRGFMVAVRERNRVTGAVLLSTVATQSVAIVFYKIFPRSFPRDILAALIWLGVLFYVAGVVLVARRYLGGGWSLVHDWSNTNCILHGAMSITGLAAALTLSVPRDFTVVVWVWVLAVFVVVETVELLRAARRISSLGWREGVFSYHVSQWSRNFTFGMLYAFAVHLPARLLPAPFLRGVHHAITSSGQYAVFAVLVVEVGLFVSEWFTKP